jgi:hypothetical protein
MYIIYSTIWLNIVALIILGLSISMGLLTTLEAMLDYAMYVPIQTNVAPAHGDMRGTGNGACFVLVCVPISISYIQKHPAYMPSSRSYIVSRIMAKTRN